MESLKPKCDDSERTKLLKEVLNSTANANHANAQFNKRSQMQNFGSNIITGTAGRFRRQTSPTDTRQRKSQGDSDDLCAELANHPELVSILKDSGQRIGGIYAKLHAGEERTFSMPVRKDLDPRGEIRITHRSEELANSARVCDDKLMYDYISKHTYFKPLEQFAEKIDQNSGFEELRKAFPRRCRHHPSLVNLTDYMLEQDHIIPLSEPQTTLHNPFEMSGSLMSKFPVESTMSTMSISQRPDLHLSARLLSKPSSGVPSPAAKPASVPHRRVQNPVVSQEPTFYKVTDAALVQRLRRLRSGQALPQPLRSGQSSPQPLKRDISAPALLNNLPRVHASPTKAPRVH